MGFGSFLKSIAPIAGAVVGNIVAPGVGGMIVGGAVGSAVGQAVGGDPMEDVRNQLSSETAFNQRAMQQYLDRQRKLFDYQERELGRIEPLQEEFVKQYGDILSGGKNPADSPMFSPLFGTLRQQRANMLRQIEEAYPTGGARERAIREANRHYGDAMNQQVGTINKWVFDTASRLKLPYTSMAGGQAPQLSTNFGALAAMQPQPMDPMMPLNIAKGYVDVKGAFPQTPQGGTILRKVQPVISGPPPGYVPTPGMYQ
jgi:hypothetical protein